MPYPDLLPDFQLAELRRRLGEDNPCVLDNPVGESLFNREVVVSGTAPSSTQRLHLMGFTARATQNISQVRVWSGATAAGATPTLVRIGVYQRGTANNDMTLVASTANDTSVFSVINTTYTKSFSAPFLKVAGTDYMVGILIVTGAALPAFLGPSLAPATSYVTDNSLLFPQSAAVLTAQADLPATITAGTAVASNVFFHALLLQ